MPYDTFAAFKSDYDKSKGRGVAGAGMEAEPAFIIYEKSKKPPLMCSVLGRHVEKKFGVGKGDDIPEGGIQWFGEGGLVVDANSPTGVSGTEDHVAQNFGVVAESSGQDDKFIGSILAAGGWDMAVNDTWVIAGIHGLLPFYCASPMNAANLLNKDYKISITGREVLGLLTFGYEFVCTEKLGSLFKVKDRGLALGATFGAYDALIDSIKSDALDASTFLNGHGIKV